MTIPFTKAHGARNDFLLTWARNVQSADLPTLARAICDRHTGIGADGWILIEGNHIRLLNSDGSEAEISGNGTRCAAALLIREGMAGNAAEIETGAGTKHLRLLARQDLHFLFEMNMGRPENLSSELLDLAGGVREGVALWIGNPQFALPVTGFDFDWRSVGAEIERHPRFPNRTNVSFFRAHDRHTLEVRFWERGAGETMSSGTGSTGAAAAAHLGMVASPVTVMTPAGPLELRWNDDYYLKGPAEIIADGHYHYTPVRE